MRRQRGSEVIEDHRVGQCQTHNATSVFKKL